MTNISGNGLHIIFGTGPVGLAVMDDLVARGKRVRMVNRSGKANVSGGVEVVEMLYEFEEDFVLDHSKFEQAFGNHATPLGEAIRTTVQWFRQNPGLSG